MFFSVVDINCMYNFFLVVTKFFFSADESVAADEKLTSLAPDLVQHSAGLASPGISRQQLINR